MRLSLVLICLMSVACTFAQAQACERSVKSDDMFLDVRDEELRILIVNVSDSCMIRFIDAYDLDDRPLQDVPWFLFWRVSDGRGRVLSVTDYSNGPWYGYALGRLIESYGPPLDKAPTRLKTGETRLVRVSLRSMMQHLSGVRQLEKKPDLPWGGPVMIELMFDVYDRPIPRRPLSHVAHVLSKPFSYRLPNSRD